MIEAVIQGKQRATEDVLTSLVFGLLKHLPPEHGLLPFLARAEYPEGTRPLAALAGGTVVEYVFWPWYEVTECHGCEPDVELRLTEPSGKRWLVMVEAKYESGKSSLEDQDSHMP